MEYIPTLPPLSQYIVADALSTQKYNKNIDDV